MEFPFRDIIIPKCDDITIVSLPVSAIEVEKSSVEIPQDLKSSIELRQREYVAGRLCAQKAIERITGEQVAVGRDERGLPVWPQNIVGSITHSAGIAGAAIALNTRYSRLGIDVEEVVSEEHAQGLLSVCTSSEEREFFGTPTKATQLFAAKEAFYKAFYADLGGIIDFTDVYGELLPTGDSVRITTTRELGSLPSGFYVDVQVLVDKGMVVAVCASNKF